MTNPLQILLFILFAIFSLAIFFEDLKTRSFRIIWLLGIFLVGLLKLVLTKEIKSNDLVLNLSYLAVLFGTLILIQSLKGTSIKDIFQDQIGLGDLLLPISLSFHFFSKDFCAFFPLSCAVALILFQFSKRKSATVPLAGLVSIQALLWLTMEIDMTYDKILIDPN